MISTVHFAGGVTIEQPRLFRAAFDPVWLSVLPLPTGSSRPEGQPVALLDNRHDALERHLQDGTLRAAIEHRPRTRIYENIGHDGTGTWFALTAWHITRLSRSDQPVMVSVFESGTGDETFGAHRDAWFSAIVQVNGAKDWEIGESLLDPARPPAQQLTTRAGDILLIPKNLPHAVTTPADPGHSAHLAFAIDREQPPP